MNPIRLHLFALVLLTTVCSSQVRAAGVITNCNEASLLLALEGGGTTTFECDGIVYLTNTITISENTILDGNGHSVRISGGGSNRVFNVNSNVSLSLLNLGIIDGTSTNGGGILNEGELRSVSCLFSNNFAIGRYSEAFGGAIFNRGELRLTNSTFVANEAIADSGGPFFEPGEDSYGGAIYNEGLVFVAGCTFRANLTAGGAGGASLTHGRDGGDARGGAIYNRGTVSSWNCTYAENRAIGGNEGGNTGDGGNSWGGAIFNFEGNVYLAHCTLSGNWAAGAIRNKMFQVFLSYPGIGRGGSLANSNGIFEVSNTVLADSKTINYQLGLAPLLTTIIESENAWGQITDAGHNISSDLSCNFTALGSMNATDPKLGPLMNNGGPTETMLLFFGSPAIDAGDTNLFPDADQRGFVRPSGSAPDIGAVEMVPHPGKLAFSEPMFSGGENETNILFTVRRAVGYAGAISADFFSSDGTALAGSDYVMTNGTLTFDEGEVEKTFGISILADEDIEQNETLQVHLSSTNPDGIGALSNAVAVITNDDISGMITFLSRDISVSETGTNVAITVARVNGTKPGVSVKYSTKPSAFSGPVATEGDYAPGSGILYFGENETNKTIHIPIIDDDLLEDPERFMVDLSEPWGATIASVDSWPPYSRTVVTIVDDDRVVPTIITPPQDETARPGDIVTFSVVAQGKPLPLYYQWFFQSNLIQYATNAIYTFTAQATNAGTYSVLITNLAGSVQASALLDTSSTILSENSDTALRAAVAQGGKIKFDFDGTIYLTNTIAISENTVLDGNGHSLSISGSGINRVFHVRTNVQFTLEDIAVIDGFSTNGGGLYNEGGYVTITNSSFLRNRSVGNGVIIAGGHPVSGSAGGGAIFNRGTLIVDASTFVENQATGGLGTVSYIGGTGGAGLGGAILNSGNASIIHSSFLTNIASGGAGGFGFDGGRGGDAAGAAIYNSSTVTLSNCVFDSNVSAGGWGGPGQKYSGSRGGAVGGAIYSGSGNTSEVTLCDFTRSEATGSTGRGGACFNQTGDLKIASSRFIDTIVTSSESRAEGGAIFNAGQLTLLDSLIRGSLLYAADGVVDSRYLLKVVDGSDARGGGLFNIGNVQIRNCTILSNTVIAGLGGSSSLLPGIRSNNGKGLGGGIANYGGLDINDTEVSCNLAENSTVGGAAGIFTTNTIAGGNNTVVSNVLTLQMYMAHSPTIPVGSDVFFLVSGEGLSEAGYDWFSPGTNQIDGENGRSFTLVNLQTNDAGIYLVRFEDNIGNTKSLSASVAPSLTSTPQSQTKSPGESVTFVVGATGTPLHYQWALNSVPIPSATTSSYTFTARLTNIGTYSVVVSNLAGTASASAMLNMAPVITTAPQSQFASFGEGISFRVAVGGTQPMIYQWRYDGDDIPGATTSSYLISPARGVHNGNYSVIVSNDFGNVSASASLALFNILHWQKSDGSLAMWKFEGTNFVESTLVSGPTGTNPAWRLIGLNDFNDDGQVDYLWQKTNGVLAVWFMNQTNRIGTVLLRDGQPVSSAWRFVGFGDFNNDTEKDILWQNKDRRLAAWFMEGTNVFGSGLLRDGQAAGSGWRAMAANDFDHDDHSDVLLQHDDGRLAIWKMSGTDLTSAHALRDGKPVAIGWRVAGLSDFNDDGEKDILMRNKDGRLAVWFLHEMDFMNVMLLRNGPAAIWRSVGVR